LAYLLYQLRFLVSTAIITTTPIVYIGVSGFDVCDIFAIFLQQIFSKTHQLNYRKSCTTTTPPVKMVSKEEKKRTHENLFVLMI
jgi:hypothetical protein